MVLAIFQVLSSHMWLEAATLESTDTEQILKEKRETHGGQYLHVGNAILSVKPNTEAIKRKIG